MIVLNFSHPLTPDQNAAIERLTGTPVQRVVDLRCQFDHTRPFGEQAVALADGAGLSPTEWQTLPILVSPPSLHVIACVLLAELHGRMGFFAPILRLRPLAGSVPPRFEVAEIVNLQAVRDAARAAR